MPYSPKHIVAQLLSYIFHPGILPTIGTIYILFALPQLFNLNQVLVYVGTVFVGTYAIPLAIIYMCALLGIIENVHLIKKRDRLYPYTVAAISAFLTSKVLMSLNAPIEVVSSTYASIFVLTISTLLIPYFKSSAHMAGIAGLSGLYLGMFEKYEVGSLTGMLVLLGLSCAIAWARIALNRHSLRELLSGAILGFGSIYVLIAR